MTKDVVLAKLRERITKGQEWIIDNLQYLTLMGSHAYGLNTENSDWDVYGVTIPPRDYIYPNEAGLVWGYDKFPVFEQYEGSIKEGKKKEHLDYQIYNITKYFQLVSQNNPNMIDSLFTKDNCVLLQTNIGKLIRANKKLFLSKLSFHRFKGYAFSQINKIKTDPTKKENAERKELIEKYGLDTKFATHVFRLLDECDQILTTGDLDLLRNKEQHKLVRQGFYTYEQVIELFNIRQISLQKAYDESTLPYGPREEEIRELLVKCLHMFWPLS